MTPAITVEVLPAGYGDCLLISCPAGERMWRLLVDTGPDECWPMLRTRLSELPMDEHGKRHIDLAVISHIDHDHIGGAGLLFSDRSLGLTFGDVWFNAPPRPAARGVAEGHALAALLGAAETVLPWNAAFHGGPVVASEGSFLEVPRPESTPQITLLSPGPTQLATLFKVWDRELERLRKKASEKSAPGTVVSRSRTALDPAVLADKVTAVDRAPANGSSIAFLLEHRGASVLLAADAFPTVLVPSLQALARHRNLPSVLKLDAIKLSHHGSRANVTVSLLKVVQADHYIISTNGAIFHHPDDEVISRVIVYGGHHHRLWFNFDNDRSRKWKDPALQGLHGYEVALPADGNGLTLALGEGQ
jgi:beta-lactamase superfamily II metal-dependent hydrolase